MQREIHVYEIKAKIRKFGRQVQPLLSFLVESSVHVENTNEQNDQMAQWLG